VSPPNRAFGGSPVVDAAGFIIGITSLRLGPPPQVNLAIPAEKFLAGRDELLAKGRVESRRPRPWLGLVTEPHAAGVLVVGLSPAGPAGAAGVRQGDVIVRLNGQVVASREDLYRQLWDRPVGDEVVLVVQRAQRLETIPIRTADRYRVFRTIGTRNTEHDRIANLFGVSLSDFQRRPLGGSLQARAWPAQPGFREEVR